MLRSALVLLLLCLLLPLHGWAQASGSVADPAAPVTPPPLVPAPADAPQPSDTPRDDSRPASEASARNQDRGEIIHRDWYAQEDPSPVMPRLLLEAVMGAVGAGVGIIPGGLLTLTAFCFDSCPDGAETRAILGLALSFAGLSAGAAAGIVGGAGIVRGQGRYWPTVAGTAIGTLAGTAAAIALASADLENASVLAFVSGPILGGIIGYEFSHADAVAASRSGFVSTGTRLVPVVAVNARGGLIGGLVGSF